MSETNNEPKMPECERMRAVKDQSQAIGEFLTWLSGTKGLVLAEWRPSEMFMGGERAPDELFPVTISIEVILAEHFDIDLNKVEEEKCALLDHIRREHDPT